ncbi:hypothetical protein DPMN_146536 [Dreissena polymorpha]|uniref:Uncharacterized protein n=1 Tax=Dreissena polymorpha TaxID=45954 RepID=A0A9D4F832_DREPO|nr:hypothetical protein DPMN_146536 [Dreissena polymorpha]
MVQGAGPVTFIWPHFDAQHLLKVSKVHLGSHLTGLISNLKTHHQAIYVSSIMEKL